MGQQLCTDNHQLQGFNRDQIQVRVSGDTSENIVVEDPQQLQAKNTDLKRKHSLENKQKLQRAIAEIFQRFDVDQDGYLNKQEICLMLAEATGQQSLTQKDATNYLNIIDQNNDGQLSLAEFQGAYTSLMNHHF